MVNLPGIIITDNNYILFSIYDYFLQRLDEIQLTLLSEHLQRCEKRFGHLFFFRSFGTIHYQIRTKSHEIR